VEQNAPLALSITERVYVLEKGQVKYDGTSRILEKDQGLKQSLLGI
jgi:ABC-type branched-subunit amino acid transport system ATPase component